jgi:hypothetical protein
LRDPAVLAMADRITYRAVPGAEKSKGGSSAASVGKTMIEVRTIDGQVLTCTPTTVPGDPRSPVDDKLLEAKFRDCISFSARPIAAANIDRAIELVADLENLADVADIMRVLA